MRPAVATNVNVTAVVLSLEDGRSHTERPGGGRIISMKPVPPASIMWAWGQWVAMFKFQGLLHGAWGMNTTRQLELVVWLAVCSSRELVLCCSAA